MINRSEMIKLLVYIKHHLAFIWSWLEQINCFLFRIRYGKKLNEKISLVLNKIGPKYIFRLLQKEDMPKLVDFFMRQPNSAYEFFKPHGLDIASLLKKNKDQSFIMIGAYAEEKLVGYCFLRCFFNGQAFRGKIVDLNYQGRGIAKEMGMLTSKLCLELGFRLFATISKDNVKSIASSKAVNEIRVVKELPNNYIYVEYLLKKE